MRHELGEVDVIITPDGQTYHLGNGFDRAVVEVGGRGMVGVEYQTFRGYGQPFPILTGWSLEPRSVTLTLVCGNDTRDEFWRARADLLRFLRFNRGGPITLRHIRADGTARDLLVYPDSGPVFENDYGDWEAYDIEIPLIAFDPLFKDAEQSVLFYRPQSATDLVFPVEFPIEFSSNLNFGRLQVTYTGDFPAWPVIEIAGPYSTITLQHLEVGATIKLQVPIAAGERRIIDLTPGRQIVYDPALQPDDPNYNKFGELVLPDSNLLAFSLRPEGRTVRDDIYSGLPNGLNTILATATGSGDPTSITVRYYQQYLGLGG